MMHGKKIFIVLFSVRNRKLRFLALDGKEMGGIIMKTFFTGDKFKRYVVFLIGLFINSLGVSLITKADLGTSPISSIPYVLSLNFPFSLGYSPSISAFC